MAHDAGCFGVEGLGVPESPKERCTRHFVDNPESEAGCSRCYVAFKNQVC